MAMIIHQAALALEWWRASGERSPERLASLVAHWCEVGAISDPETRAAILANALANRYPWEAGQ